MSSKSGEPAAHMSCHFACEADLQEASWPSVTSLKSGEPEAWCSWEILHIMRPGSPDTWELAHGPV